ncbi:acyltransferase family protein [Cupriavidus pauculus]|nr:acyltransferase family protein [Cupriavidus pauculus]
MSVQVLSNQPASLAGQRDHVWALDYRPDIDGMRALAILAVVGFHAFPGLLPGGFAGVDIFFVISGYLITRHILKDIEDGRYSTARFYAKRVKRIFPALIAVLAASAALGWLILTPEEYESLGRHMIAGAGFFANIQNWKESGYFDRAADTKPLLHLWSLGVEEQFYIVWPLILTVLSRKRGWLGKGMVALIVLSLAFSMVTVYRDVTADFYSPLTRFWELALGALLAHVTLRRPAFAAAHRRLLAWIGAALILAAVAGLRPEFAFPGAWALLPTVGVALLILSGTKAPFNRHILAARPVVWIGLISYPLYLWHWPLFALARILHGATPTAEARIWAIAASIALAWATWRFIERPVRNSRGTGAEWVIGGLCLAMVAIIAVGVVIKKKDGFAGRLDGLVNGDLSTLTLGIEFGHYRNECGVPAEHAKSLAFCLTSGQGAPAFAVLGDSKAQALYFGLANEMASDAPGVLIGSFVAPGADDSVTESKQAAVHAALQSVLDSPSIKLIIWAVALRHTFPADEDGFVRGNPPINALLSAYGDAVRKAEAAGKRVIFVIDNPTLPDPRNCVSGGLTSSPLLNRVFWRYQNPRCAASHAEHIAGTAPYRHFVDELGRRNPGLSVYDPTPLLCDTQKDQCNIMQGGNFLYSYSDHLSYYSSSMIARDMAPDIRKLIASAAPMARR